MYALRCSICNSIPVSFIAKLNPLSLKDHTGRFRDGALPEGRAAWCALYGVRHSQKIHIIKDLPGLLSIQLISSFRMRRKDVSIESPGSAIFLAGGKDLLYATQFIAAC
jgi:hypothetical protein